MEEENDTSSDNKAQPCSLPPSGKKGRASRVWSRVAWFSRKSRHRRGQCGGRSAGRRATGSEDERTYRHFLSSDSSNEYEAGMGDNRRHISANSEVIEQSCLRPSIAKALFMQLESVHLGDTSPSRSIPSGSQRRRPRDREGSEAEGGAESDLGEGLSRTVSLPEDMDGPRNKCHCIACCGCSPSERLSGSCPVYRRRFTSTSSLDRGLREFHATPCDLEDWDGGEMAGGKPATLPKPARVVEGRRNSPAYDHTVKSGYDYSPAGKSSAAYGYDGESSPGYEYEDNEDKSSSEYEYSYDEEQSSPGSENSPLKTGRSRIRNYLYENHCRKCEEIQMADSKTSDRFCDNEQTNLLKGGKMSLKYYGTQFVGHNESSPDDLLPSSPCDNNSQSKTSNEITAIPDNFHDNKSAIATTTTIKTKCDSSISNTSHDASNSANQHDSAISGSHDTKNSANQHDSAISGSHDTNNSANQHDSAIYNNSHDRPHASVQNNSTSAASPAITTSPDPVSHDPLSHDPVSHDPVSPDKSVSPPQQSVPSYYDGQCSPAKFKAKADDFTDWFSRLTDDKKNSMLLRLLPHCWTPQTHTLCEALRITTHPQCPENCQDRLSWLPHSLVLAVFSHLDPVSLGRASGVCRDWYNLANEGSLWRTFCALPKWKLSRAAGQKQILQHILPDGGVHWKRVFSERYHLRHNWLQGRCTVRTFEGHTQGVSCVQFDDTRIVSGSSDKTIKVWNIRTNSPWSVQTLVGHSGTVRCLHLEGNRLVSGSTDKTIKVWDLSTQHSWSSIACKVTMVGHTDTVRCLQVDEEKVISGSYDQTLKMWNVRTGRCISTLRGHQAAVLCVRFDPSKIISGSCDKTIKVWLYDGTCVMTLQGHQDAVTCLQFDSRRIISGSLDCNLKFWDVNTGRCSNTIDWKDSEGHTGVVRCLQVDSWRIVSASDDRTLKVWSLETGQRLVTLRNHSDGVTCLQFNDNVIVSGSYDKTVKLWDFTSV